MPPKNQNQSSTPDFIPDPAPDFIPDAAPSDQAATTAPIAPPTFKGRFGEATGLPTSIDAAKQMNQDSGLIQSPNHPILGAIGNALLGPTGTALNMAKAYGQNLYNKAVAPMTPQEQSDMQAHPIPASIYQGGKYALEGPLGPFGGQGVSNFATDLTNRNIGAAAGDLLGTAINILTLGHGVAPTEDMRMNYLTHAAGDKGAAQIENLTPSLLEAQQQVGKPVQTVGDYKAVTNKFKDNVNAEYGNAIGPYTHQQMYTQPLADAIRDLIKPNMDYTAEGRRTKAAIEAAAREYEVTPKGNWTLGALDAQRSELAANLAKHNDRDPVPRYTAEKGNINLAIDNATLKALREKIYPQADQLAGKPTGYFEALKQKQSDAIHLQSLLDKATTSLRDASRVAAGTSRWSRVYTGASINTQGTPHGYTAGLTNLIHTPDVEAAANSAARKGFSQGNPVSRAYIESLPVRYLTLLQSQNEQ